MEERSTKIFVVDDEENISRLLSMTLTMAGFDVERAARGCGALHAAERGLQDLVVLDVVMPGERVKDLLSRSSGTFAAPRRLFFADLEMDLETRDVWKAGRFVKLRPTEHKLLHYLLANACKALTRDEILEHVWPNGAGNTRVLETYICYLRRKVDFTEPSLIHTVRGVGYALRLPPGNKTTGF